MDVPGVELSLGESGHQPLDGAPRNQGEGRPDVDLHFALAPLYDDHDINFFARRCVGVAHHMLSGALTPGDGVAAVHGSGCGVCL